MHYGKQEERNCGKEAGCEQEFSRCWCWYQSGLWLVCTLRMLCFSVHALPCVTAASPIRSTRILCAHRMLAVFYATKKWFLGNGNPSLSTSHAPSKTGVRKIARGYVTLRTEFRFWVKTQRSKKLKGTYTSSVGWCMMRISGGFMGLPLLVDDDPLMRICESQSDQLNINISMFSYRIQLLCFQHYFSSFQHYVLAWLGRCRTKKGEIQGGKCH